MPLTLGSDDGELGSGGTVLGGGEGLLAPSTGGQQVALIAGGVLYLGRPGSFVAQSIDDFGTPLHVRTHPSDPLSIYVADDGTPTLIAVTHDGGATWTVNPVPDQNGGPVLTFNFTPYCSWAIGPGGEIYVINNLTWYASGGVVGAESGLFVSTDDGATWDLVANADFPGDVSSVIGFPEGGYASVSVGMDGTVWVSTDWHWDDDTCTLNVNVQAGPVGSLETVYEVSGCDADPPFEGGPYSEVIQANASGGAVVSQEYRSGDDGMNYPALVYALPGSTEVLSVPPSEDDYIDWLKACIAQGGNIALIDDNGDIRLSTDGGASFSLVFTTGGEVAGSIGASPNGAEMWGTATDGTLRYSADSGVTWTDIIEGVPSGSQSDIAVGSPSGGGGGGGGPRFLNVAVF